MRKTGRVGDVCVELSARSRISSSSSSSSSSSRTSSMFVVCRDSLLKPKGPEVEDIRNLTRDCANTALSWRRGEARLDEEARGIALGLDPFRNETSTPEKSWSRSQLFGVLGREGERARTGAVKSVKEESMKIEQVQLKDENIIKRKFSNKTVV